MRGKPSGPYIVINEGKLVHQLAPLVDDALLVYRVKGAGRGEPNPFDFEGRRWTGAEWVARWRPSLLAGKRIDGGPYALQDHNEVFSTDNLDWWIDFELERLNAWHAWGEVTTYGNFAVGSFKAEHVAKLGRMVEQGIKQGHILRFNTYVYEGFPDIFWYFKSLVDAHPTAPWFLGEVGWAANDAAYQGADALRTLLAQVRTIRHAGFRGAALWCQAPDNSDWAHSSIGDDWRVVTE